MNNHPVEATQNLSPTSGSRHGSGDVEGDLARPLDPLDYLLLAYDGVLAAEGPEGESPSSNLPASVAAGLAPVESCLRALEKLWPRGGRSLSRAHSFERQGEPRPFGDYVLLDEIARGGMGVVYRARHLGLDRVVALKMILAGQFASSVEIKRFYAEARAAAKLQHPGIVPIYEIDEHQGQHFFTMELVNGSSLQERLKQGPLPSLEAAEIIRLVALALDYAHGRGIVHRDLKPHNILIETSGAPRVTDFGLAKRVDTESLEGLTASGDILGTPSYMAPEQAEGTTRDIGPLTDVYSLGAVLYASLTGRPPFQAENLALVLKQVVETEAPPPSLLHPTVPKDLETICLKALQKRPQDRYESARAMADDLARFLRREPITARRIGPVERSVRWIRRKPGSAALMALVLLTCLVTSALYFYRRQSLEWQRKAELQAELAVQRSQLAAQQAALAQNNLELANLATAMRHFSQASERASRRRLGWTWRTLEDLARAQSLAPERMDQLKIRSIAADARSSFDMRHVLTIAEGQRIRGLAFSPDGETLALAQHRGTPHSNVFLYRTRDWQIEETVGLNTAKANFVEFFGQLTTKGDVGTFQEGMASVALSDDGRWIAAGTRLGKVCIWERGTHRDPQVLDAMPGHAIGRVRFLNDSQTLLAGVLFQDTIFSWKYRDAWQPSRHWTDVRDAFDVHPSRPLLATYHGPTQIVELSSDRRRAILPQTATGPLRYWPDGRFLVATCDNRLYIQHAESGRVVREIRGPQSSLSAIDVFPPELVPRDGVALLAGTANEAYAFDLASGDIIATISSGGRESPAIAVSPDGRWFAIAKDDSVDIYEIRQPTARIMAALTLAPVDSIALSNDGTQLVVTGHHLESNQLLDTDVTLWRRVSSEAGPAKQSQDAPMAPSSRSYVPEPITREHGDPKYDRFHPAQFRATQSVGWNEDGSRMLLASELLGLRWRNTDGHWQWPVQYRPQGLVHQRHDDATLTCSRSAEPCSRESDSRAWGGTAFRQVVSQQASTLRLEVPVAHPPTREEKLAILVRVRCVRATLDSPQLQVGIQGAPLHSVKLLSDDDYEWLRLGVLEHPHSQSSITVELTADPKTVAEVWLDQVHLLPESRPTDSADRFKPSFRVVALSPDGDRCHAVVGDNLACVWNTTTGELVHHSQNGAGTLWGGNGTLTSLAVGHELFVLGDMSGHILRWQVRDFTSLPPLRGPTRQAISALAISPDEETLAVGSNDGALRLIEAQSGKELARLEGHSSAVASLAFDAAGDQLWSGSRDGSVRLWRRENEQWQLHLLLDDGGPPIKSLQLARKARQLAVVREEENAVQLWSIDALLDSLPSHTKSER